MKYQRKLAKLFDFIPLKQGSDKAIEQRGLILAENGRKDPTWAFGCIVRVVQFQRSCEQEGDNWCYNQKLHKEQ
ncbi:MAG: hypothetical protein WCF03_20105 [Nitrososphaeraceae archaeon]